MATGQTGIAISGWGIAVDHVISDFVAGAAAELVLQGAARAPLLFVEGQGALGHLAYSGVTLGLLHGCRPDVMVLCHRAGATALDDYPEHPDPAAPRARRRPTSAPPPGSARRAWRRSRSTRADSTTTRRRAAIARHGRRRPACPPTTPCASAADTLLEAVM